MTSDHEFLARGQACEPRVYIIASTHRTGSYLLCDGLEFTDVAGRPTEALCPEYRHEMCQIFEGGEMDFSESIKTMVRRGMTSNGVSGVKVHWNQVEKLAFESDCKGPPHVVLLKEFPGARYIYISRRDTMSQAISFHIAVETGEWWQLADRENPNKRAIQPIFDAEEILYLQQELIRQCEAWEAFFKFEGIIPLRIEYESLAADYRGEVGRVLDFLGLDSAIAKTIPEPRLQKQGDELNDLWLRWMKSQQEISESSSTTLEAPEDLSEK